MRRALLYAATLLIAVAVLLHSDRAEACPAYAPSHGPAGQVYRLTVDNAGNLVTTKLNFSLGYSWQANFLPNSDCTVRWLSLGAVALIGGGQAALGTGGAFTLTTGAFLGTYNGLFRIGVGYDDLNLGTTSTGLFVGRPVIQNLAVMVATGLNFDLSAILPETSSMALFGRQTPEPPGYVRF